MGNNEEIDPATIRALWLEVIRTAWKDARGYPSFVEKNSTQEICVILDARRFLTASSGDWEKSRRHICSLVDIDPDKLREAAIKELRPYWKDCPKI